MNEEFEKWAEQEGYNLSKVHGRYTHSNTRDVFIGWQRRETEIDALKKEVSTYRNLAECWQDRFNHQELKKAEVYKLLDRIEGLYGPSKAINELRFALEESK